MSKTVMLESSLLTGTVDAKEKRDVAVVDIPGAFLQTLMDKVVHIVLRGKLVDALVRTNEEKYRKYVRYEHGRKVIYLKLKKALYGTVRASLLFWRDLTGN